MAENFQKSWSQFSDSVDTEINNLKKLSKHTESVIFGATENFFQESEEKSRRL